MTTTSTNRPQIPRWPWAFKTANNNGEWSCTGQAVRNGNIHKLDAIAGADPASVMRAIVVAAFDYEDRFKTQQIQAVQGKRG